MAIAHLDVTRAVLLGNCIAYAYHLYDVAAGNPDEFPNASIPAGYASVTEIYIDEGLLSEISQGLENTIKQAFNLDKPIGVVLKSEQEVLVAFRGTQTAFEWLHDVEFFRTPFLYAPNAGSVETGFADLYRSCTWGNASGAPRLADGLEAEASGKALSLTGHSLGAALTTLLALEMAAKPGEPPHVVTFASPLVGDKTFAGKYDELTPDSWRIANRPDVVTYLPPPFVGYTHVATEYPINSDHLTRQSWACWHALQTYMHLLAPASMPLKENCKIT